MHMRGEDMRQIIEEYGICVLIALLGSGILYNLSELLCIISGGA